MQIFENKTVTSDEYDTLTMTSIIASSYVPLAHKKLAQNYMTIKRIFGFSVVGNKITNYEVSLLRHRNFSTLESSSIRQINLELELLKKWAISEDAVLRDYADKLFEIRVKELKYLRSCSYFPKDSEFCDGYKALEKYLERISE